MHNPLTAFSKSLWQTVLLCKIHQLEFRWTLERSLREGPQVKGSFRGRIDYLLILRVGRSTTSEGSQGATIHLLDASIQGKSVLKVPAKQRNET